MTGGLPVAAVTMSWVPGDGGARPPRAQLNDAYLRALEAAGALPFPVAAGTPNEMLAAILDRADLLVLTGGADIDPARYGQPPHPETTQVTPPRDETEIALVHAAIERGMPVLAICRGMQLLNVALGGTLHQHVPDVFHGVAHNQTAAGQDRAAPTHRVRIEPNSRVSALLETGDLVVNSMHHQAVDRPGVGLVPVGNSDDGLVEAMELPGRPVVGVQWHPEELAPADAHARALFANFVALARH